MKILKGYFKGYDEEADTIDFIASTDVVDRQGESIDAAGWDLSNIGKNLPLLWAHNDRELPIGKVVSARVEDNALITSVEFAHKVNEFAKQVYDLVKAGFLNAVSVGFMPKAFNNEGQMVQQELLELSVVNIPANQEALRSNMYVAFCKSLETLDEPEVETKEGRIISEKNRNTMRIALDSMKQAGEALSDLLNTTEPPAKKGEEIKTPELTARDKRLYTSVKMVDKVVEAMIHDLKKGGE